ncbi:MAG: 16S rRNA (adenine(1518)-N(6)/adenine(1519)-N(6)) -dimethyltransferase RsmA [Pyrinomonadaceae bacterium]
MKDKRHGSNAHVLSAVLPRSKKSLGQNFLVDENIASKIVREFAPRADETVFEIGAGRGALTSHLIGQVGRLFAVEFDRDLAPGLREKFASRENFTLIEADALKIDYCALVHENTSFESFTQPSSPARVLANLPYNISTAILQHLIEHRACLSEMVLMLQREVVERIIAPPASSERGFLSVFVEGYCETEKLFDVAPQAFRPVPKVWSTVVRLRVRERELKCDENLLWQIVSSGFAQRRKTIQNNLRNAPTHLRAQIERQGGANFVLEKAGIETARRAETLALDEWISLTGVVQDGK